jgi:hypothetical protein
MAFSIFIKSIPLFTISLLLNILNNITKNRKDMKRILISKSRKDKKRIGKRKRKRKNG